MFFGLVKGGAPSRANRVIGTVLVVEDEPLVAFDNEHALILAEYRIAATVDDYASAVEVMEAGGVDLVIADINLRGSQTGLDVACRASELTLPVLFVTATCPIDAQELAVGCLAKPFSAKELVSAIRAIDLALRGARRGKGPANLTLFRR